MRRVRRHSRRSFHVQHWTSTRRIDLGKLDNKVYFTIQSISPYEDSSIMTRPLRVKFILPALTEATGPYWRPIKYSLFPPLGLATLAAYLNPDDVAVIEDEHVQPLTFRDLPDLVVIQVYITNARRAYQLA